MNRRNLLLPLSLSVLFFLTACGSGGSSTGASTAANTAAAPAAAPAATTATLSSGGKCSGSDLQFSATEFSRQSGAAVTRYDGRQVVRFGRGPAVSTMVEYTICVPAAGTYEVQILAYANGKLNNGLHLGVNGRIQSAPPGHPMSGSTDIYLDKGRWSWHPKWQGSGHNVRGPVTVSLKAGSQRLSLHKRKVERPYLAQIRLIKR